jgi:hypothetical protein
MAEETNTKNVKNDEIDLLDLFHRMGRGIAKFSRAVGRGILISIVFILRKWLPLGLSVIAGIGLTYLLKYTSKPFFTSDLVLRNNAAPISDVIAYVNRLHTYCSEENYDALSHGLSIDQESVKNIIDIAAYWIIDRNRDGIPDVTDYGNRHDVYDTIDIVMRDRFDIRVKIESPQELITIRNKLISYINSDSLFQQLNRVRIKHDRELLTRYNYDIIQLDSLQKVKYFEETKNIQPKTGGQMIFLQEQKTQLVYPDIHSLYTMRQSLESEIELYRDIVTVLNDFSIPAIRENGGMYYGIRIIPTLFFATLLVLILTTNKRKIKEIFEKY